MINRHALILSYALSSHGKCQPPGSIFLTPSSARRFFFFFFFSSFQINHKICSLQEKKTRILRVLSALRTSIHTVVRSFFSFSLSLSPSITLASALLSRVFFFLSSSVNDDDYYTQFRACLLYACMCLSARLLASFTLIYSRKFSSIQVGSHLLIDDFTREAMLIGWSIRLDCNLSCEWLDNDEQKANCSTIENEWFSPLIIRWIEKRSIWK